LEVVDTAVVAEVLAQQVVPLSPEAIRIMVVAEALAEVLVPEMLLIEEETLYMAAAAEVLVMAPAPAVMLGHLFLVVQDRLAQELPQLAMEQHPAAVLVAQEPEHQPVTVAAVKLDFHIGNRSKPWLST
jgi:hypothetical protein